MRESWLRRPFFIGRPGWVRSSAWMCDFSSTDKHHRMRRRIHIEADEWRGLRIHPFAGVDLGLAIERQMVVVLRNDDMRQQPGAGATAGKWFIRLHAPV